MADQSQTVPSAFNCEGGLVLNKSTFMMQPGEALDLKTLNLLLKVAIDVLMGTQNMYQ